MGVNKVKKPEIKEIAAFCGNQQEAILFFNYYESQGWKVGKNPMKNWKSAISGWMNRNKKREEKTQSNIEKATANTNTTLIDQLWVRMAQIYGHKWVSSYGTQPSKPWTDAINSMSNQKIAHGLNQIVKEGDDWPCSLVKFIQYCNTYRQPIKQLPAPTRAEMLTQRDNTSDIRKQSLNKIYNKLNMC